MHALVLQFLGSFAHIQDFIDRQLAKLFLDRVAPNTSDFLWQSAINRIRDSERPKLVLKIAADLGTDADLSCFSDVYARVKLLRDATAHAASVEIVSNDEVRLAKSRIVSNYNSYAEPSLISRTELNDAINACAWMEAQLTYVLGSSELVGKMLAGGQPIVAVKPSRLPRQWDGVVWRRVTDQDS
ncbi:hypothetical protein KAREA_09750 [Prescottella equi]|nr:hypothetical protein KAREA_09750 [Prescottella equi]